MNRCVFSVNATLKIKLIFKSFFIFKKSFSVAQKRILSKATPGRYIMTVITKLK